MSVLKAWDAGLRWEQLKSIFLSSEQDALAELIEASRCLTIDDIIFLSQFSDADMRRCINLQISNYDAGKKILFPVLVTPEEVFEICRLWMEGFKLEFLSREYQVHPARIAATLHRAAMVPCPSLAFYLDDRVAKERDYYFGRYVAPHDSFGGSYSLQRLLQRQFALVSKFASHTADDPVSAAIIELKLKLFSDMYNGHLITDAGGVMRNLYHITDISNVSSIMEGGIKSKSNMRNESYVDISDPQVQLRRDRLDPVFKDSLHRYVPTYVNPRNPMLFLRRGSVDRLAIAVVDPLVCGTHRCLFADGNAASYRTKFSGSAEVLRTAIDVLQAQFWTDHPDGKRRACAEVLIHPMIESDYIKYFVCGSERAAESVVASTDRQVLVSTRFFFE
jgi:hypothetical protein